VTLLEKPVGCGSPHAFAPGDYTSDNSSHSIEQLYFTRVDVLGWKCAVFWSTISLKRKIHKGFYGKRRSAAGVI